MPRIHNPDFYAWMDFLDDFGRSRQFGEDHQGEVVGEDEDGPITFPPKHKLGRSVMAYRPEVERYKRAILNQGRPKPEPKRTVGRPRKNSLIAAE